MNTPKDRAALALEVFDSLFHPNGATIDYLDECLSSALGISAFTRQACINADFRDDELSLSSLAEAASTAVNQIKIAQVLVSHLRHKYNAMEACIKEREQRNRQAARIREIVERTVSELSKPADRQSGGIEQ